MASRAIGSARPAIRWLRRIVLGAALCCSVPAFAVQPDEVLKDAPLEARARALSRDLRCMVCQNQSIDDSEAPLARDLRILVRERLTAGDRDQQVLDFLVARYGEFVLLKPPFAWYTAPAWLTAPVVLLIGVVSLVLVARRRARSQAGQDAAGQGLSPTEQKRVAELMGSNRG
jgi:cytochrome c-type biogenesis protein CcmH